MKGRFRKDLSVLTLSTLIFLLLMVSSHATAAVQSTPNLNSIIQQSIEKVDSNRLRETVAYVENYGNRSTWEKQRDAARWAGEHLRKSGLKVRLETYEHEGQTWPNVVAEIRGTTKTREIVLVSAHIDSISDTPHREAPGADDDGTGVAAVLEIARILRQVPLERTVLFCLFTNEERGTHGSKHFARYAREHALDIRAVINLDVLGYNAPKRLAPLEAIRSHHTFKHKIKSIYRMSYNYLRSTFSRRDRVKIGGRNEDAALVNIVAQRFEQYANLGVKQITGSGCV